MFAAYISRFFLLQKTLNLAQKEGASRQFSIELFILYRKPEIACKFCSIDIQPQNSMGFFKVTEMLSKYNINILRATYKHNHYTNREIWPAPFSQIAVLSGCMVVCICICFFVLKYSKIIFGRRFNFNAWGVQSTRLAGR